MATIMEVLQAELKTWHNRKYAGAPLERVGLKLGEEAGEVCRAIDRIIYSKTTTDDEHWRAELTQEIGDVAIVLLVLCNRGGLDFETVVVDRAEEVMGR